MKKLMLVILGVLMIASLAACTGGTDDKKNIQYTDERNRFKVTG